MSVAQSTQPPDDALPNEEVEALRRCVVGDAVPGRLPEGAPGVASPS